MGFLLWLAFACVMDYAYFKIRFTTANGPPAYYFLPFLGILPFYILPAFIFKPLFNYYLRNFPDVIVTRSLLPVVLVKKSAIQDVQMSDQCVSRPGHGFERTIAKLTTGKSIWFFADSNAKECPWHAIGKGNIMALNFLPKAQKFRKIAEVADHLLKAIDDNEGKLYSYLDELSFAKYQEASNLNLGKTFEKNNIRSFTKLVRGSVDMMSIVLVLHFFIPIEFFYKIESLLPVYLRPTLAKRVYAELTRKLVEQKVTGGHIEEPRDYIEATLRTKTPEATVDFLRETMLINMLATTHTTQHATMASLSYISLDKRVQRKIHRELDRVVGSAHLSHTHFNDLHYLKAAIHEAYRLTPPIPLMVRWTNNPAQIARYTVEKDIRVCMFLTSETVDPKNFPDSDAFIPERYINDDGVFESSKDFNIFSRGKRMCSAMEIGNLSAQTYVAKILQHFERRPKRPDFVVPRYSGRPFSDCPHMPLRFVRRPEAPVIAPPALDTRMTAFVEEVVRAEMAKL